MNISTVDTSVILFLRYLADQNQIQKDTSPPAPPLKERGVKQKIAQKTSHRVRSLFSLIQRVRVLVRG